MITALFWLFVSASTLFLAFAATMGSPPTVASGPDRRLILGLHLRRLSAPATACLFTGLRSVGSLIALLLAAELGAGG